MQTFKRTAEMYEVPNEIHFPFGIVFVCQIKRLCRHQRWNGKSAKFVIQGGFYLFQLSAMFVCEYVHCVCLWKVFGLIKHLYACLAFGNEIPKYPTLFQLLAVKGTPAHTCTHIHTIARKFRIEKWGQNIHRIQTLYHTKSYSWIVKCNVTSVHVPERCSGGMCVKSLKKIISIF